MKIRRPMGAAFVPCGRTNR